MRRKGGRYLVDNKGGEPKRVEFTRPRVEAGEAAADKKLKPPASTAKSKSETGEGK